MSAYKSTGLRFGAQAKYLGGPDKNCHMRGDEILPGSVLAAPAERGEKPSQLILIRLSSLDFHACTGNRISREDSVSVHSEGVIKSILAKA